jgi:hypothetical protein
VFFQKAKSKKSTLSLQCSAILPDSLTPTERSCSGRRQRRPSLENLRPARFDRFGNAVVRHDQTHASDAQRFLLRVGFSVMEIHSIWPASYPRAPGDNSYGYVEWPWFCPRGGHVFASRTASFQGEFGQIPYDS